MELKNVLMDLIDLNYKQGVHTGRWENENDRGNTAHEYLENMMGFAEDYHLKYDGDLSRFVKYDGEPKYYSEDRLGYYLKCMVEKYLWNLLDGFDEQEL